MDRNIFVVEVAGRTLKYDPMEVEIAFHRATDDVDFPGVMKRFIGPEWLVQAIREPAALDAIPRDQVETALKRRDEAVPEVIAVVCKAFGLKTFKDDNDNGFTWPEVLDIFKAWQDFRVGVKKNTDSTPSSPPPTGAPPPAPTTTKDNSVFTITPASPPE